MKAIQLKNGPVVKRNSSIELLKIVAIVRSVFSHSTGG